MPDDATYRVTWPYVAGFFDGDGTLAVRQAMFGFYQDSLPVLLSVQRFLRLRGIKTSVHEQKVSTAFGNKLHYRLEGQGINTCLAFCKGILPHLVVKRVAAQDYIRFRTMYPSRSNNKGASDKWLKNQ